MNKVMHIHSDRKVVALLSLCVLCFVVLTITQDLLRSNLHQSAFYFSESFMFSCFWWLFAPQWFAQYLYLRKNKLDQFSWQIILLIVVPIVTHLLAYPALVWLISKIFYYHTYAYAQTLRYALSEHVYLLIACYSIPALAFQQVRRHIRPITPEARLITHEIAPAPIESMLVSEGAKKLLIPVARVLYFSANPPYVEIHLADKKYLHHETLKSLAGKLDTKLFVRVHKSTVVNIDMVAFCTSRLNGDYDLTMRNGVSLRLSRNFAGDFKMRFGFGHRVTAK